MRSAKALFLSASLVSGGVMTAAPPAWALSRPISMKWEKVAGSTGYELELVRIAKGRREEPRLFVSESTKWKQEMPVGQYEIRLRSIDDRGVPGDWGAPSSYLVRLPSPKMNLPLAGTEIKPAPRTPFHVVFVEWEPVANSKRYLLEILDNNDKVLDQLTFEGLTYSRELPVGKAYTVRVAALDEDGNRGDFITHPFSVMSSIQKVRYASARLHRGKLRYESWNREVGSVISAQPVVTGLNLALELRPQGLWDFGGEVDLSNIDFGIGSVSLINAEFVVRRRIEALSAQAQYYAFAGLTFSDTAEMKGTSRADYTIGKISTVGAFLGIKRSSEFTERLSLELSARMGMSLLGVSVPNGMGISPAFSYRAEASLLYRARENLHGVLGVNYSGMRTIYKAKEYSGGTEQNFALPGDVNEISTSGMGARLGLGWGF